MYFFFLLFLFFLAILLLLILILLPFSSSSSFSLTRLFYYPSSFIKNDTQVSGIPFSYAATSIICKSLADRWADTALYVLRLSEAYSQAFQTELCKSKPIWIHHNLLLVTIPEPVNLRMESSTEIPSCFRVGWSWKMTDTEHRTCWHWPSKSRR